MERMAKKGAEAVDAAPAKPTALKITPRRPTRQEAEAAVRTLLAWTGDDPAREGLKETPKRVVDAYAEHFAGYLESPDEALACTFEEAHGYDDMVMLRDIRVESHCEHHIAPFVGRAHIAYLPSGRIVGLSKLARVVEIFAKRLQTQEALTAQIAEAIERVLTPRGVAVMIEAEHHCMSTRGVHQPGVATITSRFTGLFDAAPGQSAGHRERFLQLARR